MTTPDVSHTSTTGETQLTGKNDPRWIMFDKTLRDEAQKVGLTDIDKIIELIMPQFTAFISKAEKTGHSFIDICQKWASSIIGKMQTANERQQRWDLHCEQVRQDYIDQYPIERIDKVLQELVGRYQQLIRRSTTEGWTTEKTDTEINTKMFSDDVLPSFVITKDKQIKQKKQPVYQSSDDDYAP